MFDLISRLKDPAIFQGNLSRTKYFEGWYFKQVGSDGAKIAIIPGISLAGKKSHAFIQVFNGRTGESQYYSFPIEEFIPNKAPFAVEIGGSRFSYEGIDIEIEDIVKGSLKFTSLIPYNYSWMERGVMGWYGYVPFMETYHGLLSLDHRVNGSIVIGEDKHVFQWGNGYIEKDWGESFPSSWIWMQSNSFEEKGDSFMLSIAVIPWLGSSFIGHLAILRIGGETINLSTYRGGRITMLNKENGKVRITVQSKKYNLSIHATQGESVLLKSPIQGRMTGRTVESLDSRIVLDLKERKSRKTIFKGSGLDAGLEIMDERDELVQGLGLNL